MKCSGSTLFAVFASFLTLLFCAQGACGELKKGEIKKGQAIFDARKSLIEAGWHPMHAKKQESPDEEEDSAVKAMREAGLPELESCTGVGLNYCIFRYKKGSWCIHLVTQGEYAPVYRSPKVHQWKKYRCNTDIR